MIKVIDDWYVEIESNPTNYILRRGNGERDAKSRCKDKIYGYYSSLQNAIKALRKEMLADEFRTVPAPFPRLSEPSES